MTPINRCATCHAVIQYAVGPMGKSVEVNPDGTAHSCQPCNNPAPAKEPICEPVIRPIAADLIKGGMNGRPVKEPVRIIHETVTKVVTERPDSLEIGTPSKGGVVKVYVDFSDVVDTEQRIRNAMAMRDLANQLYSGEHVTSIAQVIQAGRMSA